jgi:hypothetical protein
LPGLIIVTHLEPQDATEAEIDRRAG